MVSTSQMTSELNSMRKTNMSNFNSNSEQGIFMTGTGNHEPNILQSIPFHPQVTSSIDPSTFNKIQEENQKLKITCKGMEESVKKYKSFLNLGAVEQEMLLKSSEQFEMDKFKMIEEQKKEIQCFSEKMTTLNKSMIEKDREIDDWKKIAEDNIKKTGNSGLRDLKLKTKEVETLKRQVDTLKTSELNLKKKQKELEKEVDSFKKQNKLPGTTFNYGVNRDSSSRGKNTSSQALVYNTNNAMNSRGSSRRNINERNRSNSQQSYKGGTSQRSNSPAQINKVRSDSNNNRYKNNYTSPGGANARRDVKVGQKYGYNFNQMKLFGKSNSREKATNSTGLISGTNYLQRNKQALKTSNRASPRGSDANIRYGSINSQNSRTSNTSNKSRPNVNEKNQINTVKPRDRSPGNAGLRMNNYLGRRNSNSRENSRDRSLNRSVNKSLNDSIEERRQRVLGSKAIKDPRDNSRNRANNNLIQISEPKPKRNFLAENRMVEAKKKLPAKNTDNILAGLNSRNSTDKKAKPPGLYNKSNKDSINTTNMHIIDETKTETKDTKGIDDRLTQLQEMLYQAKQGLNN